jgi:hypothetical protein
MGDRALSPQWLGPDACGPPQSRPAAESLASNPGWLRSEKGRHRGRNSRGSAQFDRSRGRAQLLRHEPSRPWQRRPPLSAEAAFRARSKSAARVPEDALTGRDLAERSPSPESADSSDDPCRFAPRPIEAFKVCDLLRPLHVETSQADWFRPLQRARLTSRNGQGHRRVLS